MWFYSGEDGFIYRSDLFNFKNVVAKLCNFATPDELVAVFKKVFYKFYKLLLFINYNHLFLSSFLNQPGY